MACPAIKADFFDAVTRPPSVYRGNPFQVECGLAFGGDLPAEELAEVFRLANRVPLLYLASACAITKAVRREEIGGTLGISASIESVF